jgi:hypothetical protein
MRGLTRFLMTVEKQLEGIAASPTTDTPNSTPNNASTTETPPTIPDMARCPITGMQMTSPVIASDGISYEKKEIEAWIQRMGHVSPVSLSRLDTTLPPNRALKDIIDELPQERSQPTPEIIMRVRLRASLRWIVKCKCTMDREEDFNAVFATFIQTHSQQIPLLPWPLIIDAPLCAELAWRCYKHFRMLVYMEFSVMLNEPIKENGDGTVHIRNYPITMAQTHFVRCLREHPFMSKTQQLMYALKSHDSSFKEEHISKEWSDFWGELSIRPPHLRQQSSVGDTRNTPPESSRRVHFDLAEPHQRQIYIDEYDEYGRFGTGGLHHFARDARHR